jgi:small-conductance mechanosensitive channel
LAVLGLASHSVMGQTTTKTTEARVRGAGSSQQIQERIEQPRVFTERLRNAESMEERQQIMNEQMAWQRQQAVESLKDQLGLSDREWAVLKPRIQVVYDLVHPAPRPIGKSDAPRTEAELRSRELREVLQDPKAPVDQIKARLTALRAAKERAVQQLINARQGLRQLLTLRQEALLVLNGLLD